MLQSCIVATHPCLHDREHHEVKAESARAHHEAAGKIRELEQQLESERVQAELVHLRALKRLRAEHQLVIQREKDAMDEERKRISAWMQDVKEL